LRAGVAIFLPIEDEVGARERTIRSVRLIEHRDMRLDLPFLDEPGEIRRRSVSTIRSEPLRFEPEALSGPIKHGARRADLGLSDGAGRFYVQDDRVLRVDQVVGRVGEEGVSLVGGLSIAPPDPIAR